MLRNSLELLRRAREHRAVDRLRRLAADPRAQRITLALLGVGVLVIVFGDAWSALIQRSFNPLLCNDDARVQIYPFIRYEEPGLFVDDYPGDYILATLGWGYRLLYMTAAKVLGDVRTFSKIVPWVLFILTTAALAWAATRWARLAGALVALALCLSSAVFIERMAGGLPRGFGFPVAAWAAAALVHGRVMLLATVTCLGAAFYAPSAVPPGMALAAVLLAFPPAWRGSARAWSFRKRLAVVTATAALSGIFLLPTALALRPYGSLITAAEVGAYPEAGPGGRFLSGDRPPYPTFLTILADEAPKVLLGAGKPVTPILADLAPRPRPAQRLKLRQEIASLLVALALVAFLPLLVRSASAKRLAALAAAAIIGCLIAHPLAPLLYLPQRYLAYPAPVIIVIVVSSAGAALVSLSARLRSHRWSNGVGAAAFGILCLVLTGGRGSATAGINTSIGSTRLHNFLGRLPPDALIAGWPRNMDNVGYFSKRQVLVGFETHVPFHDGYTLEMRRRTEDLIMAYFARGPEPLQRLRRRYGVTHLVVDLSHFARPATYFRPFQNVIARETRDGRRVGFYVPTLAKRAVFREGSVVVLNLANLAT